MIIKIKDFKLQNSYLQNILQNSFGNKDRIYNCNYDIK